MTKTSPTILLVSVFFLAGCISNMPRITTQPKKEQETQARLEALKHWQQMANQVASELATKEDLFEGGEQIYVNKSEFETPFATAFYKLLLTALHNEGVPVTNNADTELSLQFSVQNVRHDPARSFEAGARGNAGRRGSGTRRYRKNLGIGPAAGSYTLCAADSGDLDQPWSDQPAADTGARRWSSLLFPL